jgi:hypothetical protein
MSQHPPPYPTNPSCTSSPPLHLDCPTRRRSAAFRHRAIAPEAPRCGKEHRRPFFPLFLAFSRTRFLAGVATPRASVVRPSPASVLPTRASRCDRRSACVLPVQLMIETERGRPFTTKSGKSATARCRLPSPPAPAPPPMPPQLRAAVQSTSNGLD